MPFEIPLLCVSQSSQLHSDLGLTRKTTTGELDPYAYQSGRRSGETFKLHVHDFVHMVQTLSIEY